MPFSYMAISIQPQDDDLVITLGKLADMLHVSRITIFRWIMTGKLRAHKSGRYTIITQKDYYDFVYHHRLTQEQRDGLKAATKVLVEDFQKLQKEGKLEDLA